MSNVEIIVIYFSLFLDISDFLFVVLFSAFCHG